jgi:hypothetical protein
MRKFTTFLGSMALPILTSTILLSAVPALASPTLADAAAGTNTSCGACEAPRVQMAQTRTAPTQAGPAVAIPRGAFEVVGDNSISLCCPPAFQRGRLGTFDRMATASGDGAQPYGIRFTPDAGLDAAMLTFAPFASQYVPAGYVGNSIHLKAELRSFNPVPWTITTVPGITDFGSAALVKQQSMRAWWLPVSGTLSPSGIWSTPLFPTTGWNVPSYQWERSFEQGAPASIGPAHMLPNQWYMVKLSFQIAMKKVGDPNSWEVRDINCNNMQPKYYRIKFDYSPLNKSAGGAPNIVVEELK